MTDRNTDTARTACSPTYFWRWSVVLCVLVGLAIGSGCTATQQIRFRGEKYPTLKMLGVAATPAERELSQRTRLTLRSFDLEKAVKKDSTKTLLEMQKHVNRMPTPDLVFAVAELAFLEGRRHELLHSEFSTQCYLMSAMHAFGYLFDPRFQQRRNSYDPHFREACLFYNDSLEKILRMSGESYEVDLPPGRRITIPRRDDSPFNISCVHYSDQFDGNDLEPFKFASDYEIKGLQNEFRQYGLGVPLLARCKPGTRKQQTTKYTTPSLCFPITAVLRFLPPGSTDAEGKPLDAVVELYNPLDVLSTEILRHRVPLESDLTTPIAYSISDPRIAKINTLGLVRSDLLLKPLAEVLGKKSEEDEPDEDELQRKTIKGLYMMQPYEQGKTPVIFVHGLWSSPMAWMEMFNALRGEPELRARYQFYFYFYPTGQPFWVSAAQLREDLDEFRRTFDPEKRDPTFDGMILVGHSMGGLISHLQTLDSGEEFWNLVSHAAPEEVLKDRSEDTKKEILSWFFFQANPSIRHVVSIATPHHGSEVSNDLTQWFGRKIIRLPDGLRDTIASLKEDPGLLEEQSLLKVKTSIESLSPKQPIFDAMQRRRDHSSVHYHNIYGEIERNNPVAKLFPPSDGVVQTESARLEHCDSEIAVQCEHTMVHSHPKAILEVRRILFENLRSLENRPGTRQASYDRPLR